MNSQTHHESDQTHECECQCGKSKFKLHTAPLIRFRCHCSICQSVYQSDYSDFVIVKEKDVSVPTLNGIQFKKHKAMFAVDRGKCPSCNHPVIAWFRMIPGLPLAMIPSSNLPSDQELPDVKADIFYEKRVKDVDDATPKHSGYVNSEWQVFKAIMQTLR